jgi:hypothetical protein
MNKSAIFKAAHALTKATVQAGDSYQVTFGAALRIVIAIEKNPVKVSRGGLRPRGSAENAEKASLTVRALAALCTATRHNLERNTRAVAVHNAACEAEGLRFMSRVVEAK